MNTKCSGLTGSLLGHNFKPLYNISVTPLDTEAVRTIGKVFLHSKDKQPLIKELVDNRTTKNCIGIYCTRCGIEQAFDELV